MTNWGGPPPGGQQYGQPPYGQPQVGQPQYGQPGAPMPSQPLPVQGQPDPSQPIPAQVPNQVILGPGTPGQAVPGQPMPGQGMSAQGMPAQGMPGQGMPGPGMPGPGQPMPGPMGPGMPGGPMSGYGMPVQGPPGMAGPKANSGVLVGVSLWRLVIVIFAITGFSMAMANSDAGALAALSQQASLVAAIGYAILLLYPVFTGGRRHEPVTPWLRGALVVLLGLVSVTYLTMLGGDLGQGYSLFEHLLTPLIVLADWLFVGRDQTNARWWYPFTWLAFPLAYLLFYIAYVGGGTPLYEFLNPSAGDFVGVVFGFLAAVLAFGFVVFGLGKLKTSIANGSPRPGFQPGYPQPYPQQQQQMQPPMPQQLASPMQQPMQQPVPQPMPQQGQQPGNWGRPPMG